MSSIMSSIDEDIKFTWDEPANNESGRMPVLDLQIWLERDEMGNNKVRYAFSEKPMATNVGFENVLFEPEARLQTIEKTFFDSTPKLWNRIVTASQAQAPSVDSFKKHFDGKT